MKLTREEKRNLQHALEHVENNEIHKQWALQFSFDSYYTGNKEHFIKRHEKTIAMLHRWLEEK